MKPQILNIDSEALDEFKEKLNATLAMVVRQLKLRQLPEGTVNAKIKIQLEENIAETGEIIQFLTLEPEISMNMTTKGKVECKKNSGLFMRLDDEGIPMIGTCQIDIDEMLRQEG